MFINMTFRIKAIVRIVITRKIILLEDFTKEWGTGVRNVVRDLTLLESEKINAVLYHRSTKQPFIQFKLILE